MPRPSRLGGGSRRRDRGLRLLLTALGVSAGLAILVWLAGPAATRRALLGFGTARLLPVVLVALLPLLAWGLALRVVFGGVGVRLGAAWALPLFAASVFMNSVTPLGQVGGDPPSGALIAVVGDATFERGLAAIATVNLANRLAVIVLGAAGVAWLGGEVVAAGVTGTVVVATAGWAVLAGALAAAWLRREALLDRAGPPVAAAVVRLARALPVVEAPDRAAVERRFRQLVDAFERLAGQPRRLAAVLALGAVGHLAVAATLWLVLAALDVRVAVPVVLAVLALATVGGLAPTPGGAAGATALLAGLLVGLGSVSPPDATVAALVYRFAAFWFPAVLGGFATVGLIAAADTG